MVDKMIEVGWTELATIVEKSVFEWTQKRAYFRWLEAGSPVSDGKEFWFAAEQDWLEESKKPIELPKFDFPPICIPSIITDNLMDVKLPPICTGSCIETPSGTIDVPVIPPIIFCAPPVIDHCCKFEEKCNG